MRRNTGDFGDDGRPPLGAVTVGEVLAMSSGALYNFLVPALGALYGTPPTIGNAAPGRSD